jgi:iron complex transport system ATP-binding protein
MSTSMNMNMNSGAGAQRQAVMTLREVTFAYPGGGVVVDGVSATVAAGAITALIGPNAAGKSTLIHLMLGHLRPVKGKVLIDDRTVTGLSARQRAQWISYVPQRTGASLAFSVRQVIAMGRFVMEEDRAAVEQAAEACEVADLMGRVFDELSVGQQQRVLLARAVAQSQGSGRLMLLDEPTSGMDLAHVHRTMAMLRRIAATGLAVVVVMHDLNLAARYGDAVWLMDRGRLAAAGQWQSVLRRELLESVYGIGLTVSMEGAEAAAGGTGAPGGAAARPRFEVRTED